MKREGCLLTAQLLVLATQLTVGILDLVQFVNGALQISVLVLQIALAGLVQHNGLIQAALQLHVVLLQGVDRLLQLAARVVGLLQIDDQYFDLTGQTSLGLLQIVDLNDEGFDMLLQFGDAHLVLATNLFNLLGTSCHFGIPFVLPRSGIGIGLDQLTFQVDASFGLFFELRAS